MFFPKLLDDFQRDVVAAEGAAGEIYLALRQFGPEIERVLGGLSWQILWKVINLFTHLRSKVDLSVKELAVLREDGLI